MNLFINNLRVLEYFFYFVFSINKIGFLNCVVCSINIVSRFMEYVYIMCLNFIGKFCVIRFKMVMVVGDVCEVSVNSRLGFIERLRCFSIIFCIMVVFFGFRIRLVINMYFV